MSFSAQFSDGQSSATVSAASDGEAGRRCALDFNPSRNAEIAAMQAVIRAREVELHRFAALDRPDRGEIERHHDALRCHASSLTQIESGCMFAVKGVASTLPRN